MERIGSIYLAETTQRTAEPDRFGEALRSAASSVASRVASTVALAAPFVPGGSVLAGAVKTATASPSLASSSGLSSTSTTATGGDGDLLEATRALQQQSQSFNLEYLQLQESMQRQSREFTALSNVMKVKHDTAKAAIDNVH
jgi:hypothetical protein